MRRHTDTLRRLLDGVPRGRVLDVGSGTGYILQALQALGYTAEGIDADPAQVATAQTAGLDVTLNGDIAGVAETRPGEFQVVTMFDLLEHIPVREQLDVVAAARKLLSDGGVLVIQTPNALSPIAAYQRYVNWTHTSSFTTVSLRPLLRNAGFTRMDIYPEVVNRS